MAAWSNKNVHDTRKAMHANAMRSAGFFEQREAGQLAAKCYANNESGVVADFASDTEVEQLTSGGIPIAAPVIEAPVAVDLSAVVRKSPVGVARAVSCAAGKGLFANTYGVDWQG